MARVAGQEPDLTGLRGWIYLQEGSETAYGPTETMTAAKPWQILFTAVGANMPALASGLLAIKDVILGVSTGSNNVLVPLFTNDTRKRMGWAIGAAETGDGWMNLKRWRAGVTNDVSPSDSSASGQPQRYYRLEAAAP